MKVKLETDEWGLFKETPFGLELDVPDALVIELRQLRERLDYDFRERMERATDEISEIYWDAITKIEEEKAEEAEVCRDTIRAKTLKRQNAKRYAQITEEAQAKARESGNRLMKQYVMTLDGEMPRGIVYADSPLRKKDEDAN